MRIGVFGGTFDPVHRGHLALARHAYKHFELDKIIFIPAKRPPHKTHLSKLTPANHRFAMVKLALDKAPYFSISDCEIRRKGISYTVDTLKWLRRNYPKAELFLILGQDSYESLESWRQPNKIKKMVHFLVAKRPRAKVRAIKGCQMSWIRMRLYPVSASTIRKRLEQGKSIGMASPKQVVAYIKEKRLYLKKDSE